MGNLAITWIVPSQASGPLAKHKATEQECSRADEKLTSPAFGGGT